MRQPARSAARSALRVSELSCVLGGREVLCDLSLRLERAAVTGVFGPNGAGKTTLLRIIAGSLRPLRGRIWLGDRDVSRLPQHRRARLGLAYLPQGPSAFAGLSARANVEAVLQVRGVARQSRRRRAMEALALFGLDRLAEQRASTLSGGERRRLELARTLALRPAVALLDEPFAALDPSGASDLTLEIAKLASAGVAVLLTDHRLQSALTICQRACMLIDGRIIADADPQQLIGARRDGRLRLSDLEIWHAAIGSASAGREGQSCPEPEGPGKGSASLPSGDSTAS